MRNKVASNQEIAAIVVPLLNQVDAWLEQCLRSALQQKDAAQVVVVTSRHTCDSNLSVLRRLAAEDARLLPMQRPTGVAFAGAINAGVAAANCDRVGLLLSDDWLAPDALSACLTRAEDLVSTGRIAYDADGRQRLWQRIPSAQRYARLQSDEARADYIGYFMLFRRKRFLDVGGVDPKIGLTGADDYDLTWTLLEAGAKVGFIERGLYCVRDHDRHRLTLRDPEIQIRDLTKILRKHGIAGKQAEELIARKRKWFGKPIYRVLNRTP